MPKEALTNSLPLLRILEDTEQGHTTQKLGRLPIIVEQCSSLISLHRQSDTCCATCTVFLPAVRRSTCCNCLHNLPWKFNLSPLGMLCRTDIWYIGKIGQCKAIDEVRSGLWGHLEAKTASKNLLEKIWLLSLSSSSVNEFQKSKGTKKCKLST